MVGQVLANGMVWGEVKPLIPAVPYHKFVGLLLDGLRRDKEDFLRDVDYSQRSCLIRKAFAFRAPDLNNPREVGWAVLLPPQNAATKAVAEALQPLIDHRGGKVIFSDASLAIDPANWIFKNYTMKPREERPYYVLLAGSPKDIPFRSQYLLDVHAAVGRLCFERVHDYAAYAQKVVEFETNAALGVERRAVLFATEHGPHDATALSRRYMADPLADRLRNSGIPVQYLAGNNARLDNLEAALRGEKEKKAPALVYTATHGLGVPGADGAQRRRLQGALVCQDYNGTGGLFSADRVPDTPFLHGSLVFSFACFGAGTPQGSDYYHWVRIPDLLDCRPTEDFVAALPTRLLAHPKGPLAFFGHVDPAWVYSFADPDRPAAEAGWGSRMRPFREMIDQLLQGAAVAYGATGFNEVYAFLSVHLADMENEFRRDSAAGKKSDWTRELVETWMTRNDMQNYVTLGDPAVKAKV